MTDQRKAYLLVALAVLFWSTVATAFKLALRDLTYIELLFVASAVSLAALFLVALIQRKLHLVFRSTWRELLRSALLAVLNPFLYYLILFRAYSLLPAQEAQPLNYTWPIVLAFLSVPLLKQPLTRRALLALFLSFLGVVVISTRGKLLSLEFEAPLGVLLAVSSSVVWALFWIFNVRDGRDPVVKLLMNFAFGTVYVSLLLGALSGLYVPTWGQLARAGYVGLFEMGLTFVLWLKALSLSGTTARVSNLVFLSPFLSLVFIRLVLGERLLPSSVLGLVLIVAGIVLQAAEPGRRSP